MPRDLARRATVPHLRSALAALLAVGLAGTALELVLMEHLEDWWQRIPLALIGAGLVALAWHRKAASRGSVIALRLVMLLFLVSAGLGVVLHAKGNREFALERAPDLAGREMLAEMATGAFPALAPGTMALLGLIGLLLTWRHPSLGYPE
ncbi:MAG TPA: hypothetical protein VF037_06955 [Gemmatimonadales bacterium]